MKADAGSLVSGPRVYASYSIALAVSISLWFLCIRAPLWLDETVSIYLSQGGIPGILSRQVWPDSPVYSWLLWLWTQWMGRAELTLRISSVLPMLLAVYLLYLAARQLFPRDVALFAAVIFCLHPIIIFAAIDVRPYAFAAVAVNATILCLIHLRRSQATWLAALFGVCAAGIVQFQLLFATLLPALLLCFVLPKLRDGKVLWRQLSVALITFTLATLPVIPRVQYMLHTRDTHVFSEAPSVLELGSTLTLKGIAFFVLAGVLIAAARRQFALRADLDRWVIVLCLSLALVPSLILFGLSVGTSMHVFVPRYRLAAIPGIALCWAFLAGRIASRSLRLLCCVAMVAATAAVYLSSPALHRHQYSWKYALDFIQANASRDHAPVLICSDIPEADHMRMPVGPAIEASGILPPLSYYPLTVPVVPLPRTLNDETMRVASEFLQSARQQHERFLAAAFAQSYATLDWLAANAGSSYVVHTIANLEGVKVLEFVPRNKPADLSQEKQPPETR